MRLMQAEDVTEKTGRESQPTHLSGQTGFTWDLERYLPVKGIGVMIYPNRQDFLFHACLE